MTTTDHLARLGRMVRERREQLGLRQDQMGVRGGPSTTTLTKIENATGGEPPPSTLRKLDKALGWMAGSSAEVLRGGEPTREDEYRWRVGYELDYDPLVPVNNGVRDDELEFIATTVQAALGMLQKRRLWPAIQLINLASSDLSDYIDSQEEQNAEPAATTPNPPAATSGTPGAADQEDKPSPLKSEDQGEGEDLPNDTKAGKTAASVGRNRKLKGDVLGQERKGG